MGGIWRHFCGRRGKSSISTRHLAAMSQAFLQKEYSVKARLKLIVLLVTLLVFSTSFHAQEKSAQDTELSCRKFVQVFYDWYVPLIVHEQGNSAYEKVLKQKENLFNPDLHAKLVDDFEAQAKTPGEIVGLDFDPFLNSQDPSEKFLVQKVALKNDLCFVTMRGIQSGKMMEKVTPELAMREGHWQFVNFHYGALTSDKDSNLLSDLASLKKLREEPNK
jgi:hypothetical protein